MKRHHGVSFKRLVQCSVNAFSLFWGFYYNDLIQTPGYKPRLACHLVAKDHHYPQKLMTGLFGFKMN